MRLMRIVESVRDPEIVEQTLVVVLRRQTGISQITFEMVPFVKTAIVKHLEIIGNDKRDNPVGKTLFKHHQTPHPTVTILKRMNRLKTLMEVEYIFQRLLLS